MGESVVNAEPLKNGLPHVAYVTLWYPLFTQPFIFREAEGLREILPTKVYALYGKNTRHCSREMKEKGAHAKSHGVKALPRVLADMASLAFSRPKLFAKLFGRVLFRRWPNIETFGENLWAFCAGVSLGRQFREDGIDMAYAPWPRGSATAAWVAATIAGVPFAAAARGDNLAPADPDLEDKLAAADFIRANNKADKTRIETFGSGAARGKTFLVHNSLTLIPPDPPPARAPFRDPARLLALGRFDVTKGFDTLMEACAILKNGGVRFRLTLAGAGGLALGLGNMEKKLRSMRKELDLEDEVAMPGLVSHDELPSILQEHDIFVAPCVIHPSGKRDGIPNSLIEAMAFGMPVVGSSVNALPEVIRHGQTGLATPQKNPEALAGAIRLMIENPEMARDMGVAAAKLARETFDPKINAQKLADLFVVHQKTASSEKCAE